MKLTQKILDKALNSKKTELGVGFGGEPTPSKPAAVKVAAKIATKVPSMGKVPMRNDAQAYNQYPRPTKSLGNALSKAKVSKRALEKGL